MNKVLLSFNVLITTIIVIISFSTKVSAINCYQCSSNDDLECSEKFDQDYTKLRPKPCNELYEANYCIKTTGIFEGEIGTKRFCSSRDYGDYCDYVRRPGDERDYRSCVFTCYSDSCNHSTAQYISRFTLMSIISFTFLYLISNF